MNPLDFISPNVPVAAKVQELAGRVFELDNGMLTFPENMTVTTEAATHTLRFTPPAKIAAKNFPRLSLNVSGARLTLDSITFLVDRFPDFTVNFQW